MPYRRRYRRNYRRRPNYRRQSYQARKVARQEIAKNNRKHQPINYRDITFGGNYVKTTPTVISVGDYLRDYIDISNLYDNAPARYNQQTNETVRLVKVLVTGIAYQFRFQQNDAAADVYSDTVRTMAYKFNDTWSENNNALMSGSDIDQPPNTLSVPKVYYDRIFALKPGITETGTDDSQFVPGTRIIKGYKKMSSMMTFEHTQIGDVTTFTEGNDIRFEHCSDDNSTIGEVEVYGYIRIYFRVINA